jgi:hypothetical protein
MEAKTAEKKVLFFDEPTYKEHVAFLERMSKGVDWLGSVWRDQEMLIETPFTTEHLHGILSGGVGYIEDTLYEKLQAKFELLPGMTAHILNGQRPKVRVDANKMDRTIESLVSPGPMTPPHARYDMIEVVKERAAIRKESLQELRDTFSVYDTEENREMVEMVKKGEQAAKVLNDLQKWIRDSAMRRQALMGFTTLPAPGKVEMFTRQRQPGQPWRSVFYQDPVSGTWVFNARRLKNNF